MSEISDELLDEAKEILSLRARPIKLEIRAYDGTLIQEKLRKELAEVEAKFEKRLNASSTKKSLNNNGLAELSTGESRESQKNDCK